MKGLPPDLRWFVGSLWGLTTMRSSSTFFCPGPYPCLCACLNSPFYKDTIMSLPCSSVTTANCTCNIPRFLGLGIQHTNPGWREAAQTTIGLTVRATWDTTGRSSAQYPAQRKHSASLSSSACCYNERYGDGHVRGSSQGSWPASLWDQLPVLRAATRVLNDTLPHAVLFV